MYMYLVTYIDLSFQIWLPYYHKQTSEVFLLRMIYVELLPLRSYSIVFNQPHSPSSETGVHSLLKRVIWKWKYNWKHATIITHDFIVYYAYLWVVMTRSNWWVLLTALIRRDKTSKSFFMSYVSTIKATLIYQRKKSVDRTAWNPEVDKICHIWSLQTGSSCLPSIHTFPSRLDHCRWFSATSPHTGRSCLLKIND